MSITERIRYGAIELKRFYNRNLALALVASIVFHLFAIGLYMYVNSATAEPTHHEPSKPPVVLPPIHVGDEKPKKPEQPRTTEPAGRSGGMDGGVKVKGDQMAIPLVVDVKDTDDLKAFPTASTPVGSPDGDSNWNGMRGNGKGDPNAVGTPKEDGDRSQEGKPITETPEEIPVFVEDGNQPTYDVAELVDNIEYPRLALEHEFEGTVTIQVVVETDGSASNVKILESSNSIFDKAAIEAVKKTTFTPGRQNGVPLRVYLTIPVKFELRQ